MSSKTRTTNSQQERRQASKEALLDSAMRSFHQLGYARTTVADIVAATDYTAGAFYFHFDNKADCLWHVIAHRELKRADWSHLVAQADREEDSLEDLVTRVFAHFAATLDGLNAWVLVMVDFAQQHRNDPVVRKRLADLYLRWREELEQFVVALQAHGWVDAGRAPKLVATQLFAYSEGIGTHLAVYDVEPDLAARALIDGTVRILAAGPHGS